MQRVIAGNGKEGATYYTKPLPLVQTPWVADVVIAREAGTTGIFFGNVPRNRIHAVYEQLGNSPSTADRFDGEVKG